MDFSLRTYHRLLQALLESGYQFLTFEQYCLAIKDQLPDRFIVLRHDVDLKAVNSLRTAEIEAQLGIHASYYFRIVPASNQPSIIRDIVQLKHEIGYHYEDMSIANGEVRAAIEHFSKQLAHFRQFYPVQTICMHGAPTSKYDSRLLWQHHDYHQFGIIGEPYFDIDFSQMFYLTDTGRCWDGYNVSVRDKIPHYQDLWVQQGLVYHSTGDLIYAIEQGTLPARIMITTHPQRWTNNIFSWLKELLLQSAKNTVKRFLIPKNTKI